MASAPVSSSVDGGAPAPGPLPSPQGGRTRLAVAADEAFSFYYADNLEMLEAAGAEIVFFSPLRDAALPDDCCGLYLGGGFPEMYAGAWPKCQAARRPVGRDPGRPAHLRRVRRADVPDGLADRSGRSVRPMIGAVPGRSVMTSKLTMGYRVATACRDSFVLPAGRSVRGHEFHYSDWIRPACLPARRLPDRPTLQTRHGGPTATPRATLFATYVHLHFGAAPELPARSAGGLPGFGPPDPRKADPRL